jgi:DNA-binding MarR family transcriptional regulator
MLEHIDRTIHEPGRLHILIYLYSVEKADFTFLRLQTGMTQGNLSSHLQKLEAAGYISMEKKFRDRRPLTLVKITDAGRHSFREYVVGMHDFLSDLKEMVK